jgi:hypothetical protein
MTLISLVQKYNKFKYVHINSILTNNVNSFFNPIDSNNFLQNTFILNPTKLVNNFLIKQGMHWKILKDSYTSAYILSFDNLLILHIDKNKSSLNDFEYLYNNSIEYTFKVYETNNYYHLVCISKYLDYVDFNPHSYWTFLIANDSNLKYFMLSSIYKSFLIINKGIIDYIEDKNTILHNLPPIKYKFVKYIGQANIETSIENTIDSLINIVNNNYLKYAPIHFLSIGA